MKTRPRHGRKRRCYDELWIIRYPMLLGGTRPGEVIHVLSHRVCLHVGRSGCDKIALFSQQNMRGVPAAFRSNTGILFHREEKGVRLKKIPVGKRVPSCIWNLTDGPRDLNVHWHLRSEASNASLRVWRVQSRARVVGLLS